MTTPSSRTRSTPTGRATSVSALNRQLTPQPQTGDNARRSTGKKAADQIDVYNNEDLATQVANSEDTARVFLEQKQLIPMEENLTIRHMCQALVVIANQDRVPSVVSQMIRSVVYLLREMGLEGEAEGLADKLHAKLAKDVTSKVIYSLEGKMEEIANAMDNQLKAGLDEIRKIHAEIPKGPIIIDANGAADPITQRFSQQTVTDKPAATYASMVKHGSQNPHATAIARSLQRRRQFWVDQDPVINGAKTEKELVEEANKAVNFLPEELRKTGPNDVTFISVKKLQNGGFLYELKTPEAVSWLRKEEVKYEWLGVFPGRTGKQGTAKGSLYNTIAKFVPTTFQVGNEEMYREVEMLSDIPSEAIESARWIKPVERRNPGQKHAHMILSFSEPEHANDAIAFGMTIEGKQIQVEKLIKEVKRCNNCMKLDVNHIARNCPSPHPTCGKCSGDHNTDECACDADLFKCPNCRQEGHTAFDRCCPAYIELNAKLNDHTPDNDYIFFVTEDPATHVRHSERYAPAPLPTQDQPRRQSTAVPGNSQSQNRAAAPSHRDPPPHKKKTKPIPSFEVTFHDDEVDPTQPSDLDTNYQADSDIEQAPTRIQTRKSPVQGLGTVGPRPNIGHSRKGNTAPKGKGKAPAAEVESSDVDEETLSNGKRRGIRRYFERDNTGTVSQGDETGYRTTNESEADVQDILSDARHTASNRGRTSSQRT